MKDEEKEEALEALMQETENLPSELEAKAENPGPKGFGVDFWGYSWRFKLYDDLYTDAKNPDGTAVRIATFPMIFLPAPQKLFPECVDC